VDVFFIPLWPWLRSCVHCFIVYISYDFWLC
jgi:hypothetical protein